VTVSVRDGVVSLRGKPLDGRVAGRLAHDRVLEVVSSVPGVRALEDRILIGGSEAGAG
jgi:osmotically-inducible protein OsmY